MRSAASIIAQLPGGKRYAGIKGLLAQLRNYLDEEPVGRVFEAYQFAEAAHKGQTRLTGEPYITHPVAVAGILATLHLDHQSIMAALLHDVIEDTGTGKEQIGERFGADVAELVDAVSKLDQIRFRSKAEAQAESFRKMILALAQDIRVILVKLADRLHNMRTLEVMPTVKRRRIARETLEIYAPIANRLGIHKIRLELEDLGLRMLYPQRYKVIQKSLKRAHGNRRAMVKKVSGNITQALAEHDLPASIDGRQKHLYSIYQKMRSKGRSLAEIVDVIGIRLLVESVDDCYRTLGLVHRLYKPMPGRFKDYIAIPKVNGYQSLHTTLFGPNAVPIEVQIRTEDMHKVAESGVASHWLFKTGERGSASQARAREWVKGLVEMQEGSDWEEFLESVKLDLFPDKVYLFTPRGDIMRLPKGATAVDFAYAVHTDVGNRCAAAKVDRRQVPLRTPLRNGQTVEIITARGAKPNPAWVNFVVTAKARTAIRHYLKNLRRSESVALGKRLLTNALADFSLSLRKIPKNRLNEVLAELGLDSREALYSQVGLGEQLAPLLARRLAPADDSAKADTQAPLAIKGTEGMVVTHARCCYPIPDDPIMGYLSAGRGIVIHRECCGNLAEFRKQPDKWIAVDWTPDPKGEFTVEIRVEVVNRPGVLAAVAANFADTHSNIEHVSAVERDGDTSSLIFQVNVTDRAHLARVVRSIRAMGEVLRVTRTCA